MKDEDRPGGMVHACVAMIVQLSFLLTGGTDDFPEQTSHYQQPPSENRRCRDSNRRKLIAPTG